ncbi:hypothetical protein SUGI_0693400 [Cryptomeria japonica]|nr:hypothetical protein SUGI_0693400 [Cryptomeria japonica]
MERLSDSLLISFVVLFSMTLQLVLVFGGSFRHRFSSIVLQLVLWLAYMSSDAVAIYALGTMARESSHTRIFGVWAPLLLLHLGGPDTITAYSTVDNELWTRHLLIMLYQVLVAIYVMYASDMKSYLLAASILLLLVGGFKYAEKTATLRLASNSQIVKYCQPVYKYMSIEDYSRRCSYAVMGLVKWERTWTTREIKFPTIIQDIWRDQSQQGMENYILCLSHALFKMNMRRYTDLYIHEIQWEETREFFFRDRLSHLSEDNIFTVIEIELKFMYDALFSKSMFIAFSKIGATMRIINICLLVAGGLCTYRGLIPGHEKVEVVAYIVISVAVIVELLQLLRIIASDWTLVWLICSSAEQSQEDWLTKLKHNSLRIALWLLHKLRSWRKRKYWKESIQQYSLIDTCKSLSPFKWKWAKRLILTDIVTSWYIESKPVEEEFKQFIIGKLNGLASDQNTTEQCRQTITSYNTKCGTDLEWASGTDQEHLILHWHIATTICLMERRRDQDNEEINKFARLSETLSNYCAHLLVSKRDLLPLHSDIARMEYIDVHSELLDFLSRSDIQRLRHYKEKYDNQHYEGASTLSNGAKLARMLLRMETAHRWRMLSEYWAAVLIYYANFKKPLVHAEYLTVGGEFITQLWALLGHMGFGTQKD